MNLGFDVGIALQDPFSVEMETLTTDVLTTATIYDQGGSAKTTRQSAGINACGIIRLRRRSEFNSDILVSSSNILVLALLSSILGASISILLGRKWFTG